MQKWISQLFFFLLAADRSNFLEQTTRPDYLLDPDHQTWPDQTRPYFSDRPLEETGFARPDQLSSAFFHRPPSQASIVYQWAWHYYSTPSLHRQDAIISFLSQVRSILCVLDHGRLIYKALDEPYKTCFPHTFGLKSLDFLFRLYLIVVRVASGASGAPWVVKGLPYPFSIIGLLCKYLASDRSLAFKNNFGLD